MGIWGSIKSVGNSIVHGAEDAANTVTGTVTDTANSVAGATTQLGDGVVAGGHNLAHAVSTAAETFEDGIAEGGRLGWEEAKREYSVAGDYLRAEKDKLRSRIGDTFEGLSKVGEGVRELLHGEVVEGLKDIGSGSLRSSVLADVDASLIEFRQQVSAVQTLAHLEKPSRGLNDAEVAEMRKVFGDEVDFSQVRIKEGRGGAGVASLFDQGRAFTNGNTIYMEKDPSDPAWLSTLAHELTHVWQFQHTGGGYQTNSITNRIGQGEEAAYSWEDSAAAKKPWNELNAEQQGRLIQDAYKNHMFDNPAARYVDAKGNDLTDYVREAIKQLRAGAGAP